MLQLEGLHLQCVYLVYIPPISILQLEALQVLHVDLAQQLIKYFLAEHVPIVQRVLAPASAGLINVLCVMMVRLQYPVDHVPIVQMDRVQMLLVVTYVPIVQMDRVQQLVDYVPTVQLVRVRQLVGCVPIVQLDRVRQLVDCVPIVHRVHIIQLLVDYVPTVQVVHTMLQLEAL
jgi:hypothetical protein